EFRSGRLIQLGQRSRRAKCQGRAVLAHRFAGILHAVPPALECSDLAQAVFDVVEGMQKDVELAVPTGDAFPFEARPVHPPLEAAADPEPRGVSRRPVPAVTAGVEPTLK